MQHTNQATAPAQMAEGHQYDGQKSVKVWDPLVRIFHWSLVGAFFLAYLLEDEWLQIHAWAGYVVLGLVGFRLIWGFIGGRHARWSDFVQSPQRIASYIGDVVHGRAERYLGHNPAGGAMVVALIISLLITGFTGLVVYGAEEFSGPLAGLMADAPSWVGHWFEEVHEFFANFTVFLVVLHVAGVIHAGLSHGENLVRSMITGYKRG